MERVMLTHVLKIKKRNYDAKKTTALSHTPKLSQVGSVMLK